MSKIYFTSQRKQDYDDYLETEHWKRLRASVLFPACLCKICRNKIAVHAHHRVYRNFYDVTPGDLIAVCQLCHSKIHAAIDQGLIAADADAKTIRALFPEEPAAKTIAPAPTKVVDAPILCGAPLPLEKAIVLGNPKLAGQRFTAAQWKKLNNALHCKYKERGKLLEKLRKARKIPFKGPGREQLSRDLAHLSNEEIRNNFSQLSLTNTEVSV